MNRSGARIYTGTLTNVGTSFSTLTVSTPSNPPTRGFITQVIAEVGPGLGSQVAATIEDVPIAGQDIVYDDGSGGTIDPFNDASNRVYYEGISSGIPVEVKVDAGADTTVKITLLIEPA